jgi:hypothetical protein
VPILIIAIVAGIWWYRKKNSAIDYSGQEWDDDEDDLPIDDTRDPRPDKTTNVNRAVNF